MVSTPPVPTQLLPRSSHQEKVQPAQNCRPKASHVGYDPRQSRGDYQDTWEKPSSIRDLYHRAVIIIEHRWSPGLHMNLTLAPPVSALLPNKGGGCQHSLEDVALAHFRSNFSIHSVAVNTDLFTKGHTFKIRIGLT